MKFVLEIELGNDAMRTSTHIASALREVSKHVVLPGRKGFIRDINGNTVGKWEFKNV